MKQLQKSRKKLQNYKNSNKISVFDLDHTILTINSSFRYYFYLRKKKILPFSSFFFCFFYFFQYCFFSLSPEKLHQKIFNRFLKNKKKEKIFGYVQEFFSGYLSHFFYSPVMKALKKAKQEGHIIYLLSNSPDEIASLFADYLNVDAYQATKYKLDKEGKMQEILYMMGGEKKAEFMKNIKGEEDKILYVFSDSIWDLPLFLLADCKIAVNPDRKLKKIAKKNRWQVI